MGNGYALWPARTRSRSEQLYKLESIVIDGGVDDDCGVRCMCSTTLLYDFVLMLEHGANVRWQTEPNTVQRHTDAARGSSRLNSGEKSEKEAEKSEMMLPLPKTA